MKTATLILASLLVLGTVTVATAPAVSAFDPCDVWPETQPYCDARNDARDRAYCLVFWEPVGYWTRCL